MEGSQETVLSRLNSSGASWVPLSVAAVAGASVGLLVGIFVGRATVDVPEGSEVATSRGALQDRAPAKGAPPEVEVPRDAYRIALGQYLPKGKASSGFERLKEGDRPVVSIPGREATLHFPFKAPEGKNYALTAIARVKDGPNAKLAANFDGKSVSTWTLEKDWTLYSSPLDTALLGADKHRVILSPSELPSGAVVQLDSLAVVPVEDVLTFKVGADSRGHLVEGFAKPEARAVWSDGPRSVIAGVLAPVAGQYEVVIKGSAYPPIAPLSVRLAVNGKDVGTAEVTKKIQESVWKVPAGVLAAGPNELEFSYPQTGQPKKFKPGSTDERNLAVRFFSVTVSPDE